MIVQCEWKGHVDHTDGEYAKTVKGVVAAAAVESDDGLKTMHVEFVPARRNEEEMLVQCCGMGWKFEYANGWMKRDE